MVTFHGCRPRHRCSQANLCEVSVRSSMQHSPAQAPLTDLRNWTGIRATCMSISKDQNLLLHVIETSFYVLPPCLQSLSELSVQAKLPYSMPLSLERQRGRRRLGCQQHTHMDVSVASLLEVKGPSRRKDCHSGSLSTHSSSYASGESIG
jgi:hypothetical protein